MRSLRNRMGTGVLGGALALMVQSAPALEAQEVDVTGRLPGWTGHAVAFQPASESLEEGFLVVWGVERIDLPGVSVPPGPEGVFAQRVTYGAEPDPADKITLFEGAVGDDPAVAFRDRRRQDLVTWAQEQPGAYRLWGTVLEEDPAAGPESAFCGPFVIQSYQTGGLDEMSVAYNEHTDDWMVVWEARDDANQIGLFGRLVSDCGAVGPLFQVNEGGFAESPSLSYSPRADRYLAVWPSPDGRAILGRMLMPDGTGDGPVLTVASCAVDCGGSGGEMQSAWAVLKPDGQRWLVFWSETCQREARQPLEERPSEPPFSCEDPARIYARFVSASACSADGGTELANPKACLKNPVLVSDGSGHSAKTAAAYSGAAHKFLAVWTQWLDDPDASDVYGRWLHSNGRVRGDPVAVRATGTEEQTPEAGGHVACSDSRRHCLAVLNEYDFEHTGDGLEVWANVLGVWMTAPRSPD